MTTAPSPSVAAYLRQICGEYLEMPGLRLTSAQAERLLGLEPGICKAALAFLVNSKFLYVTDAGQYARLTEGAAPSPPLRMAKAELTRRTSDRRAG
jgi:hypothetical protein